MQLQNEIRKSLLALLSEKRKRNPRFSLRGFSKKIGLSPATLSNFLNGKYNLSERSLKKIANKLNLSLPEKINADKIRIKPNSDDLKIFASKWHSLVILALFDVAAEPISAEYISRRLSLNLSTVKKALLGMQRIGLVKSENNLYVSTGLQVSIAAFDKTLRPKENIRNDLKIASRFLSLIDQCSNEQRPKLYEKSDFSSIKVATNIKKIAQAKKKIAIFRANLSRFLQSCKAADVYLLNIQLLPLTE